MNTATAIVHQGPAFRPARRTARHGNSLNRFVTLLMVAAVTVVFTAKAFPQEVEDEIISEYGAGTLTFQAAGGKPVPALLQATSVTARVSGLLNRVTVKQSFANDSADFVEGVYLFPLPDDAAVDTLEMRIGNRVIVGEIQEKQQARRTYERARAAGQRTSLVQQRRPNLFSTRVANVAPGEVVDIEVGYLQTLHYDQGEFRLRLPMTVTPRYEPPVLASSAPPEASTGDATWQRCEQQSARCHYTDLYLEIDPGFDLARLESLYHAMDVQRAGRTWRLQPADGPILMDRDFELVWQAALGATPEAAIFTEQWQGETFAMIMLLPPEQYAQPATQPRELVFVIDTSGSMDGTSIEQATGALRFGLQQLQPGDRFNIIRFSSEAQSLFNEAMPADSAYLHTATQFVDGLRAGGGTNIGAALRHALDPIADQRAAQQGFLRQVVFITDGSVGNERQLFGRIENELGDTRLFTVGIGSAPNDWFMRKAAQHGRGTFTHIGDDFVIEERMEKLFTRLDAPALQDIEIDAPRGAEIWPERIRDLYRGEPVLVRARLGNDRSPFVVRGKAAQANWQRELSLQASEQHAGVAALWGRTRIEALLDTLVTGADETQVRAEVVTLALRHHLVSRYTSLVAVDRTPVRAGQPLREKRVALNAPHGSTMTGYPAGGTPMTLLALGGLMSLLLAWMTAARRRMQRWATVGRRWLARSRPASASPYWDWQ